MVIWPIITSILGAAKNNQNAQQAVNLGSAVKGIINSAGKMNSLTDKSGQ